MADEQYTTDYTSFLQKKSQRNLDHGFAPHWLPDFLFDFQRHLVDWALRKGRAAIFADCGLGKTPMQLVWAQNVVQETNKPVLILTPLAVGAQTVLEGEKFGIPCHRSRDGKYPGAGIVITNYEKLHLFDRQQFGGVVCDESSILKSFDGVRRQEITVFMRHLPYRLLCTATAAPNDYIELGTSSEALGYLGYMDMLQRFFKNALNNAATGRYHGKAQQWHFRGHAEQPFWQWVCSWARALRSPSDMGYDNALFTLPPLIEQQHIVEAAPQERGLLFPMPALTLQEQRAERRATLGARCKRVAHLVAHSRPALVWCHLNDEGNALERMIPDARQVSGKESDEEKEAFFLAFVTQQLRVLITKPTIGAWGLNFQHCAHETFFPSHSYEQYYQGIRRCWRFGQHSPVAIDLVTSPGEANVLANLQRKSQAADRMFANLVTHMRHELTLSHQSPTASTWEMPTWIAR